MGLREEAGLVPSPAGRRGKYFFGTGAPYKPRPAKMRSA
jgi:hypothetical protein